MAYAYNEYTGTTNTDYLISFEGPTPGYLNEDHVIFYLNGVAQANTERTFIDATHVQIAAPLTTDLIRFQRESSIEEALVDWLSGAGVSASNLDMNTLQMLYLGQETKDDVDRSLKIPHAVGASVDTDLPTPTANYVIGWDAAATGMKNVATTVLSAVNFDTVQNYTDIATAVATIGATPTTLLIDTLCTISANLSFPSTLTLFFIQGGKLKDDASNATLTINGDILATDSQQIFDWGNGSGKITHKDGNSISASWHGGLAHAYADIHSASDIELRIVRSETISSSFSVGANITTHFKNGAILSDDASNADLTFLGPILHAPGQETFDWGTGTGTITLSYGTSIEGSSTSERLVLRQFKLTIEDGTAADSLKISSFPTFNSTMVGFPLVDSLTKDTEIGNFELDVDGESLVILEDEFEARPLILVSAHLISTTGAALELAASFTFGGEHNLDIRIKDPGAAQSTYKDLTALVDLGYVDLAITYLTVGGEV